jgi:flagellar biosynthesis protein FliR
MSILDFSALELEKFLLILLRVGGILIISPVFGHRNIPTLAKIGLMGMLALILVPIVPSGGLNGPGNLGSLFTMAATEIIAGLVIGFAAILLFMGVQLSGQIIGFQIGFSMVEAYDPSSAQGMSIIGQFQYILALLVFLAIDGHHLLIGAIVQSFSIVPIGHIVLSGATAQILTRMAVDVFAIAVKLSAPVLVTLFLTDVALGIIARTVPQMNVFIVSFPLKIGAGMLILVASLPFFNFVLTKLIQGLDKDLIRLIASMKGAA